MEKSLVLALILCLPALLVAADEPPRRGIRPEKMEILRGILEKEKRKMEEAEAYARKLPPELQQLAMSAIGEPEELFPNIFKMINRPEKTLQHGEQVQSVAFNNDGTLLASGGFDGSVKIWDVNAGVLLHTLRYGYFVESVVFNNDGTRLAVGGGDGVVKTWDVNAGVLLHTQLNGSSVNSVAFDKDGIKFAVGGSDGRVRIWDANTGVWLQALFYGGVIESVAFDNGGTRLASGGSDPGVGIWDLNTGVLLYTLPHGDSVKSVAFNEDGTRLSSAGFGGSVKTWDTNTGILLGTWEQGGHVISVAFDKKCIKLASGAIDGNVRIWDTNKRVLLQTLLHGSMVVSVAFNSDGTKIASAGRDNVKIWDVEESSYLPKLLGLLNTDAFRVVKEINDGLESKSLAPITRHQMSKLNYIQDLQRKLLPLVQLDPPVEKAIAEEEGRNAHFASAMHVLRSVEAPPMEAPTQEHVGLWERFARWRGVKPASKTLSYEEQEKQIQALEAKLSLLHEGLRIQDENIFDEGLQQRFNEAIQKIGQEIAQLPAAKDIMRRRVMPEAF